MNLTTLRKAAAIAAAYAAVGTLGALAAGPALGPSLWWLMNHELAPPSPSVLSVALLVLGVIWVSAQDSGEDMEPVRPVSPGLLARLAQRWHEARERCERDMAASSDYVVSRDDLDYAEALMFAGRGLRF